jgi:hypothetical protein
VPPPLPQLRSALQLLNLLPNRHRIRRPRHHCHPPLQQPLLSLPCPEPITSPPTPTSLSPIPQVCAVCEWLAASSFFLFPYRVWLIAPPFSSCFGLCFFISPAAS